MPFGLFRLPMSLAKTLPAEAMPSVAVMQGPSASWNRRWMSRAIATGPPRRAASCETSMNTSSIE